MLTFPYDIYNGTRLFGSLPKQLSLLLRVFGFTHLVEGVTQKAQEVAKAKEGNRELGIVDGLPALLVIGLATMT